MFSDPHLDVNIGLSLTILATVETVYVYFSILGEHSIMSRSTGGNSPSGGQFLEQMI